MLKDLRIRNLVGVALCCVFIRPIPDKQHVETYVKAYYIGENDLEQWLRNHKVDTPMSLYVYLFVCFLVVCLSICLPVCLSVCLSVYLSACLSICLPVCLSVCLSVYLSACLSICMLSRMLTMALLSF